MRTPEEVKSILMIRQATGAGQQEAIAAFLCFGVADAIMKLNSGWRTDEKVRNDEFQTQVSAYNHEMAKQAFSIRPAIKNEVGDYIYPVCDKDGKVIGETVGFPNNDEEFDDLIQNYFFAY